MFSQLKLSIDGANDCIQNKKARELLALLLVHRGGPVKKLWAAETLWPQADQPQAMDSLYKVLRFWRRTETLNTYFPLQSRTGELGLALGDVFCDLWAFEEESASGELGRMESAVERYTGPLLFQEYYEWTAEREAFYELRYLALLDELTAHYVEREDGARAAYYRQKRDFI